jgi:hypothetical protein
MRGTHTRHNYTQTLARLPAMGGLAGPRMLRALVLALIALIVIFVGLMELTGQYEAGVPVIGGILLIGLGAAQYARK